MKLNKKFRTFVFSNILLGAIAFNNLADDDFSNMGYKDGITNVSFSQYPSPDTAFFRIDYQLNGEKKMLREWIGYDCFHIIRRNLFKTNEDDGIEGILSAPGEVLISIAQIDSKNFVDYLKKLQCEDRLPVLLKKDKNSCTVAHWLATNKERKFMELLYTFERDWIIMCESEANEILSDLKNGGSGLELARRAAIHNTYNFIRLLPVFKKLDKRDVVRILVGQGVFSGKCEGRTVAHLLVREGNGDAIIKLLRVLGEGNIMITLLEREYNAHGLTLARVLAEKNGDEFIELLIELLHVLGKGNIMKILESKDENGDTVAHELARRNGHDDRFINLLGMLEEKNIMQILKLQNNDGFAVAHELVRHSHGDKFMDLLRTNKLTTGNMMKILSEPKNYDGLAVAHTLACYGGCGKFENLLDILGEENIVKILLESTSKSKSTVGQMLAEDAIGFISLLNKFEKENNIMILLGQKNSNGWTCAHQLAVLDPSYCIWFLCEFKENDNIMKILGWKGKFDGDIQMGIIPEIVKILHEGEVTIAKILYRGEPYEFYDLIKNRDFTSEQKKQEINELVGQDVFVRR